MQVGTVPERSGSGEPVREDYSDSGDAWNYFTHDQARSRAYRWGEDGLAGLSDERQRLCFALALWNGKDPILKERLFGLTNSEGNHGEDVKEYYFYLDNTPTHAYVKYLYKYPQRTYPYADLVDTNRRRTRDDFEYELLDTGVFNDDRYFDVFVEYAKAAPEDILVQISASNRGGQAATLHVLPTLWFRRTWSGAGGMARPVLRQRTGYADISVIAAAHPELGDRVLHCEGAIVRVRLTDVKPDALAAAYAGGDPFGKEFDATVASRRREADDFYQSITPPAVGEDAARVMRQALAGMLWSKQYYYFDADKWLDEHDAAPLIALLFFDGVDAAQSTRVIRLDPATNRTYHYWHAFVPGVRPGQLYGYRATKYGARSAATTMRTATMTRAAGSTGHWLPRMPTCIGS